MRVCAMVVVMVAWLAARRETAEACSCVGLEPQISPADGAADVPLNAVVFASHPRTSSLGIRLIEVASGQQVATTGMGRRWVSAGGYVEVFQIETPTGLLAPFSKYEIEVTVTVGGAILRTQFSTGSSVDNEAPPPAALDGFEASIATPASVCDDTCAVTGERLRFPYAMPGADVAWMLLELREAGRSVAEIAVSDRWQRSLGATFCDAPSPVLTAGQSYCGRLVTGDLAGNRTLGPERCSAPARTFSLDEQCAATPDGGAGADAGTTSTESSGCRTAAGRHAQGIGSVVALGLAMLVLRCRRGRRQVMPST